MGRETVRTPAKTWSLTRTNRCPSQKDAMRPTRHKMKMTHRLKTRHPAKNQGSLGGATPQPKRKRIRTKADLEREIKREKVINHAEKLLDSMQEFNPELEYYCSSLMPLLEKLDFEKSQCCMIAIQQTIFTFMFPRHETATRPMSVRCYMAGGLLPTPIHQHQLLLYSSKCAHPHLPPGFKRTSALIPTPSMFRPPLNPMRGLRTFLLMKNCENFADEKPCHTT